MNTPYGIKRADFNEKINSLIAAVETSYENNRLMDDGPKLQKHLDALANKYQFDEELGPLRHKIYDAQSLLFYLSGQDERALEFADAADEINNSPTSISSQIRNELMPSTNTPIQQNQDNKIHYGKKRIEGWLAILVLALIIGIGYNIYGFFSEISTKNSITPDILSSYPGIDTLLNVETAAAGAAIVSAAIIIYLIFTRRRTAKYLGIVFFVAAFFFSIGDIVAARDMFANNQDALTAINQAESSSYLAIVASAIWAFYLLFSQRVKQTLTR